MENSKTTAGSQGGDAPVVWVSLGSDRQPMVERARAQGWGVLDLALYGGNLPPGTAVAGAFVDKLPNDPLVTELMAREVPTVRLGRLPHPEDGRIPAVIPDRIAAGRLAAEHFSERKFRDVGFVCYPEMLEDEPARELHDAFRDRAAELGCVCHILVFKHWDTKREAGISTSEKFGLRQAELAHWLEGVPKPIGIFTFGDVMAGRLAVATLDRGLEIPKTVAVLGYGGDESTCVSAPLPLSTIDPAPEERWDAAIRLMQGLMDGKPVPDEAVRVSPVGVVVRESTDVLASTDPAVVDAIRYMWDHLAVDLSVDDVAAAVVTPRRKLERAFHDQIGHGINAELQRRRLEHCCELLRTTKLTVADIAPMVGFRSRDYLHTLFRRRFGMTPRAYRLANPDVQGSADAATS